MVTSISKSKIHRKKYRHTLKVVEHASMDFTWSFTGPPSFHGDSINNSNFYSKVVPRFTIVSEGQHGMATQLYLTPW